jgi:hypothetical protein
VLKVVSGVPAYAEEDPDNFLLNANFEGGNTAGVATSWDKSNSTGTAATYTISTSTSEVMKGAQAQKIVFNGDGTGDLDYRQMVTVTSGMTKQWVVGIGYSASSTVAGFQICSMVDNAEKDCVPTASLILDGLPHTVEIPTVITGTTNIGIKVKSTNSTGTVILDKAYIRQGIGTQNLQLDNVFSAQISAAGAKSLENKANWLAAGPFTPSTSTFTVSFATGQFTVAPVCVVHGLGGSNTYATITTAPTTTSVVVYTGVISSQGASAYPFELICQKSGNDYLASSAAVYSQASANTDWAICTFAGQSGTGFGATVAMQGFGTVTNTSLMCRRNNGMLEMKGRATIGTVAASEGQFLLPNNFGTLTTATITGTESGGFMLRDVANTAVLFNVLRTTGAGYFRVAGNIVAGANNPNTATNPSGQFNNNDVVELSNVAIPISGWSNAAMIVGSFAGVPSTGEAGNVDMFSFTFAANSSLNSACTTGNCYVDQIGNKVSTVAFSATGTYILTPTKTYTKLSCVGSAYNDARVIATRIRSSSAATATFYMVNSADNNYINYHGTYHCIGSY